MPITFQQFKNKTKIVAEQDNLIGVIYSFFTSKESFKDAPGDNVASETSNLTRKRKIFDILFKVFTKVVTEKLIR